jgi:hypothetical protein
MLRYTLMSYKAVEETRADRDILAVTTDFEREYEFRAGSGNVSPVTISSEKLRTSRGRSSKPVVLHGMATSHGVMQSKGYTAKSAHCKKVDPKIRRAQLLALGPLLT